MLFEPRGYQKKAIEWILEKPKCGLFLDMGLGKTACVLSAIERLKYDYLEPCRTLVIAPLRVARTVWAQEARKWGMDLKVVVAAGEDAATRKSIFRRKADIYVINRELVSWLVKKSGLPWEWDIVVLDELSGFKSPTAQRFRALKQPIKSVSRVIGLTGTPVPNGYLDLWAQAYLLDGGKRLGRTIGRYKTEYFLSGGYQGREWFLQPGADARINSAVEDICLSMKKEDWLDMPDRSYMSVEVELPKVAMDRYKEMEKKLITDVDGSLITAAHGAAATQKLRQMTGGAVYDADGAPAFLHDAKLEALGGIIEDAGDENVLVFVEFRHEVERLLERFKDARELKSEADIDDWNGGRIKIAVAHPASVGHGLNLQKGGHIVVWYGLTWSLELYEQANDRLYRSGQEHAVAVYHLVCKGTVDTAMLAALRKKEAGQKALMDWMDAKRRGA